MDSCKWRDRYCTGSCSCSSADYNVDTGSVRCAACGLSWDLGGEAWSSPNDRCCGDDGSEFRVTEHSSTDAPAGYNSGQYACCNPGTDCQNDDSCLAAGTDDGTAWCCSTGEESCSATYWYGGDAYSSACTDIVSAGRWQIGGEASQGADYCCGDDGSEFRVTETGAGEAPAGYNNGITTCCNPSTDCTHDDVCRAAGNADGTAWCCSTGEESCNANTWYGADDYSSACIDLVGANLWNIGGDISNCCGDDGNENTRTCQDGGAEACAESGDDYACCTDSNACVYDDSCYSQDDLTSNGAWRCNNGIWEPTGVIVTVDATPASVTTTWQNTDATASIDCSTPSPATSCVPGSYRLRVYTSPGTCSTDYATYSTPGTRAISSHVWVCGAAKDNLGNEGFSDDSPPVEFRVDKEDPTVALNSLPAWINQVSVTIIWVGSDTGDSGILGYDVQRRTEWTNGTLLQGWTDYASPLSSPLSIPGLENNKTYSFRVRATDQAGNTGDWSNVESVSVDLQPPICSVDDLPYFTVIPNFNVNWLGSDMESDIQYYDVQARASSDGCGGGTTSSWGWLNDPDGFQTTDTSDMFVGAIDGCTFFFRCKATDLAGNEGVWSAEKSTTVDATPPISSVDPLPQWINTTSFQVSWDGFDGTSGIDCYNIQWSNDSTWYDWFPCTTSILSAFGPASPVTLAEGSTYSFRSKAIDNAGNEEAWPGSPDTETTIDLSPPDYYLAAYDQDGESLKEKLVGVEQITVHSRASDNVSGVLYNYIEWTMITETGEDEGSYNCGLAAPYGGISDCNWTIDFAGSGGIMIEYWVRIIDRAGNEVTSPHVHIGTHPLANFGRHSLYISMGESATVGVYVRNIRNQPDNITVTLSSTLSMDPYFVILEDMTWVVDRWIGNNIELMDDNRTLIIYNLNPGASPPPIPVMVWSSDVPDTYEMNINAFSSLAINDTDQAMVQINYPTSFPGLNEWAILVLIMVAVVGYSRFGKVI